MTFLKTLSALGAVAALTATAQAATVSVTVTGVEARPGTLYVGLQTEAQYLKNEGEYGAMLKTPTAGTHQFDINDVPPGRYSLSVLHDEDGNDDMTLTDDYRPAEGWAMVNGETLRASPTFDQTSFEVTPEGASVTVKMLDYQTE